MSEYTRIPQTTRTRPAFDEDQDLLESLQNIPSNFDVAINGTARKYLSPSPPAKDVDVSLLDPESFRRLSISTISSYGRQSRGVSPTPEVIDLEPRTWKTPIKRFWYSNLGLFLVTISQMFGALMNVTTRLLEGEGEGMHPFQVLFARMPLTLVFCCLILWYKNVPGFPLGIKEVRWLLVARGLTGFFGIFGMYYSLQYLPVADAVVITFLAPSVASYGCYIFLKEPFPRSAQYASAVSLLGVVLIARPTSFFSSPSPTDDYSVSNTTSTGIGADFPTPTSAQRLSAVAVAMLGVLGTAGAYTSIRWIGTRAHPLISVNYFAAWCTIVSTVALSISRPLRISDVGFALPSSLRQWSMLIFLGVCGFFAQFTLTTGLAAGGRRNGARATNMIYTQMLFALGLDKVVFGQSPGMVEFGRKWTDSGKCDICAVKKQQGEGPGREVDEEMVGGGFQEEEMSMLAGADIEDHERERGRSQEVSG